MEIVMPIITVTAIMIIAVSIEAVTVSPLCPTNKIAPHRRASWEPNRGRTFAAFYDLLSPDTRPNRPIYNDLQEKPQADDPDDCGEIEDYDENDLSSITQSQRRKGHSNHFQGVTYGSPSNSLYNSPQYDKSTKRPATMRPQRPTYLPTRPPYWNGGFFGGNPYRPPSQQSTSDYIKPVNENTGQVQVSYYPYIVGGPLGHVVGYTTERTTTNSDEDVRFPRTPKYYRSTTPTPTTTYTTRHPRSRKINENTILGSFIDLLFK